MVAEDEAIEPRPVKDQTLGIVVVAEVKIANEVVETFAQFVPFQDNQLFKLGAAKITVGMIIERAISKIKIFFIR